MDLSKAWKLVDGTLDKKEGRVEYTATRRSRSEGTTSVHSVVLRGRPLHENEEFNKDYIMNSGFFVMYSTEVTEDTGGDVLILRDKTGGKKIRDQLAPMDFSDFEEAGTRKTFISFVSLCLPTDSHLRGTLLIRHSNYAS